MDDAAKRLGRIASLLVLALLAAALPETAAAESNVMLVPAAGVAGTRAALLGRDFGRHHRVAVRIGGHLVARSRTNRHGTFRASFIVPAYRHGRNRVVTRSRHRRIVNLFFESDAAGSQSAVGEVAARTGRRMRWSPLIAPPGSAVQLRGSHFPHRRLLRIRFSGRQIGKTRTSRRGRFSTQFSAPLVSAGHHLVRVRLRSRGLGFLFGTTLGTGVPAITPVLPAAAPPTANTGPAGVVYAAGDIACAPGDATTSTKCHAMNTSNIITGTGAARVLALGDLQYNSASLANLRGSYDRSWGRFKAITSPAVGNHEGGANGYFDYFNGSGAANGPAGPRGAGYYSFDVGSWHLIALNSNCARVACSAGSPQVNWLRADLAAHPTACTLAYWHHPRFSSGYDGDGTFMQDIWKTLYDANADLVLVGHSHDYERLAPLNATGGLDRARGIREIVVGTGGAFFTGISNARPNSEARQNNTFGVLKLTLGPTSYDWRFVPEAGKTFSDAGTQACH
jgi:acid phosphatase type 7